MKIIVPLLIWIVTYLNKYHKNYHITHNLKMTTLLPVNNSQLIDPEYQGKADLWGIEIGCANHIGQTPNLYYRSKRWAKYTWMEDSHCWSYIIIDSIKYAFGAVFDGHATKNIPIWLKNNCNNFIWLELKEHHDMKKAIQNMCWKIKYSLALGECLYPNVEMPKSEKTVLVSSNGGACAVFCLINITEKECIMANLGDCRGIIMNNDTIVQSTTDHDGKNSSERKRVMDMGGKFAKFNGECVERLIPINNVNEIRKFAQGLLPSRALGDIHMEQNELNKGIKDMSPEEYAKKCLVSGDPEFSSIIKIKDGYKIIMVTDGIFYHIDKPVLQSCGNRILLIKGNESKYFEATNENICEMAKENETSEKIAKKIVDYAYEGLSPDNLTAMVITIKI